MDLNRLVLADPSGNITAIVFDPTPRSRMPDVASIVQSSIKTTQNIVVEQVVFVENQPDGSIHAQMAGGEFCGNAARAVGYVLTDGQPGRKTFTMSGTSTPVTVDVGDRTTSLTTTMTIESEQKLFEDHPISIVHLEGISHAVMLPHHPLYPFLKKYAAPPNNCWDTVIRVLQNLEINDKLASGLIFAEPLGDTISITPYVYVPAANTLYAEHACASGSIAAQLVVSGHYPATDTPCLIRQPSGENLAISINRQGGGAEIHVAGSMTKISDGPAIDLRYMPDALAGTQGPLQRSVAQRRASL